MQSGYITSCANIAFIEGFTQQREVPLWQNRLTYPLFQKIITNLQVYFVSTIKSMFPMSWIFVCEFSGISTIIRLQGILVKIRC